MEYIQRKIDADREQFESNNIRVDIVDGKRLTIRCRRRMGEIDKAKRAHVKVRPEIVVNFTEVETEKIKVSLDKVSV